MALNKHYLCINKNTFAQEWDPAFPDEKLSKAKPDIIYFGRALAIMEQSIGIEGLTIYVTWDTESLPSYGENIVAIVLGDEWCRIPLYAHKVLAVFKGYGTRLTLASNPFTTPSYYSILCTAQFFLSTLFRLRGVATNKLLSKQENIFDIPIGCFNSVEVPIKEFSSRIVDLSFIGGIGDEYHKKNSIKSLIKTPKIIARRELVSQIKKLSSKLSHLKIHSAVTPDCVSEITTADAQESYIKILADTKICLVPRGTSLETFRFFEAMKYGCILIVEKLPNRWFYNDAPVINLQNWSELESRLLQLDGNTSEMEELHKSAIKWWNEKCAENSLGQYMANCLSSLI
jgi:hypothetical protein